MGYSDSVYWPAYIEYNGSKNFWRPQACIQTLLIATAYQAKTVAMSWKPQGRDVPALLDLILLHLDLLLWGVLNFSSAQITLNNVHYHYFEDKKIEHHFSIFLNLQKVFFFSFVSLYYHSNFFFNLTRQAWKHNKTKSNVFILIKRFKVFSHL